jgi:hypothetical protein
MVVFSIKIPEDLKKKMYDLSNINWSEEIRLFLNKRVQEEKKRRNVDPIRLEKALR